MKKYYFGFYYTFFISTVISNKWYIKRKQNNSDNKNSDYQEVCTKNWQHNGYVIVLCESTNVTIA